MLNRRAALSLIYRALADPTRRAMLDRLVRGPATVGELAGPLAMSLPAVAQHLQVLEQSGLVTTRKVGRVRVCRLEPESLATAAAWLADRLAWEHRLRRLGDFVEAPLTGAEENKVERSVAHGSFTVERVYRAPAARVFAAWADPVTKRKWFGGSEWDDPGHVFEFRVGGREYSKGEIAPGQSYSFDVRYYDIVDNERIVYAYEMHMNGARISVSIATIEFKPEGTSTRMTVTEHGAFLDGLDTVAQRREGTEQLIAALGTVVET